MSNKLSPQTQLLKTKLKMVSKKLHMTYPAFSRLCQIDYVLRNKHLIPSKNEVEEVMAREKLKIQPELNIKEEIKDAS